MCVWLCVCKMDATKDLAYIETHNGIYSICKWVYNGIVGECDDGTMISPSDGCYLRILHWNPSTSINIHQHPYQGHPSSDIHLFSLVASHVSVPGPPPSYLWPTPRSCSVDESLPWASGSSRHLPCRSGHPLAKCPLREIPDVCPFYRWCSWKKNDVISHDFPLPCWTKALARELNGIT